MQSHQPYTELAREVDDQRTWQLREIEAALRQADACDFASDAEVAALAKKWKLNQGY